ncbi:MAG: hypothetical protein C5S48_09745 [Candidatus Methanogaster sp.]|nr:MAG: hypothetical protein C5S48_09745 [ANME-2 cluster archaeon]
MRHYRTKNVEDLIRQIESDDELTKEFENAELVESHVVSVHVATPEHGTRAIRKMRHGMPI